MEMQAEINDKTEVLADFPIPLKDQLTQHRGGFTIGKPVVWGTQGFLLSNSFLNRDPFPAKYSFPLRVELGGFLKTTT